MKPEEPEKNAGELFGEAANFHKPGKSHVHLYEYISSIVWRVYMHSF